MRVSIQVEGFSPPGLHTDVEVSADNDYGERMLGDVVKPGYLQGEMIDLLGRAVGQLCGVYGIDPAEIKVVTVIKTAPPKPAPVRTQCVNCGGSGRWLGIWKCHPCEGKGWVMSS